MSEKEVVIYTRPMCSDCQALKEFLADHQISYHGFDVKNEPEKERELKEITGTQITPGIVITVPKWMGLSKERKVFIGFENNESEIKKLLL